MRTVSPTLRALAYGSLFVLFWWWVALAFRRLDSHLGGPLPSELFWPGVVLAAAGGVLGLACVVDFVVRGSGTPAPFDPPRKFLATGLYRRARNPMYIGGFGLLAGLGLLLHSPGVLLLAFLFLALAHVVVIRIEEPTLRKKFGTAYEEYLRTVPRWLPKW